jgi:hypothetical protein
MDKANEGLDKQTNTNPFNQVAIINKETKKKPYDIKIKNNNPNEPKINVNMKYSDKQKYRRYKTKVEPKLFSKIMIDEEDDIVNTIKKAFGIEPEKKQNLTAVETSEMPYYQEPNPEQGEEPDIVEMYREPEPEPEPEQAPAPAPAPAPARRERKPKPDDIEVEPKTSREITSKLALPSPLTASKIKELFSPTKEREAARAEAARAEAAERREEEEAAKKRLETLSALSLAEKEKEINKKIKEREEEYSKPLSVKDEETFQKHLKKEFRDLTEEKVQWLRKQYKISGNLPDPKYFGRTSEEIDKKTTEN